MHHEEFFYTKIPFNLKNIEATYQYLIESIFAKQIGRYIKVYIDNMVIKSLDEKRLLEDVEETQITLERVKMKLNPGKCSFGIEDGQFLGYYITKEGIQPSSVKVDEVMDVPSPHTLRAAQVLNGKLTTLSCLISKSAEKAMPIFHTLKGCIEKSNFQWKPIVERMLQQIKEALHKLPTQASPI